MTTRARPVRPTDLVALVSFEGKVCPNQAVTWESLGHEGQAPHPLESAVEQWFSFATGSHTWISVQGQTIRGLVSARQRSGRTAWEVTCLLSASGDEGVYQELLGRLCYDAGRSGSEKVFLRLASNSEALPVARAAGFIPYMSETLFGRTGPAGEVPLPGQIALRPRSAADLFPLYQLYNVAVPEAVRRAEAATFGEWRANREVSRARRRQEWVVDREDGRLAAWLRAGGDGDTGRFDLLVDPQQQGLLDGLMAAALFPHRDKRAVFCLVPEYKDWLSRWLPANGFVPQGHYVLHVKRLLRPVTLPKPVPAAALRSFGVH